VALAMAQSVELRRHVDQQRLARRVPGRTGDRVPGHRTFRADTPRPLPPQAARRYAIWALGSSGAAILLAAVALLTR
jgi:hypothetical protein